MKAGRTDTSAGAAGADTRSGERVNEIKSDSDQTLTYSAVFAEDFRSHRQKSSTVPFHE
jgi:hypothetical protein